MASSFSAASCLNAQPSAMRRSSASSFARGQGWRIVPLKHHAVTRSRPATRGPVRVAAANQQWESPNNTKASPYTSSSGRDMPGPRDLYEGTTGVDVLAMQKDLVAEGYLTPSDATGVFTPTTRASVETLQQQYGLPINGVWGSLERQIFDNARIRTLPPQSAEALLPPDYNKSKAKTKYSTAVSSHTQNLMPKSLKMPGAEIPDGVGGVVAMAGAGLFTAAMITKADSVRREGGRNNGPRGGDPRVFPRGTTRNALSGLVDKLTGRSRNSRISAEGEEDYYRQQSQYDQQMAALYGGGGGGQMNMQQQQQQQQRGWVDGGDGRGGGGGGGSGGGRWFNARDAQAGESFDPFPGGYPIPPTSSGTDDKYGGPVAHPPLRPGDRRRMEMEAENQPKYHPAFDGPNGSANQAAWSGQPPPPPPPKTPPPPHMQKQQQQQQPGGWPEFGDNDWTGDDMGPPRDYLISSTDIENARNSRNDGLNNGRGPSRMSNSSSDGWRGGGGGGGGGRPASRTTASVPPYGGWGGGLGPSAVPEYGGADNARALGSQPPNLKLNPNVNHGGLNGGGGGGAMAAMANGGGTATATAVMPPPARVRSKPKQQGGLLRGISTGISDGLKSLSGAPNSSTQLREQSEFTARAQRERELMAQVQEAQKFAQMEQKKRQQLEAAYAATRNALTEAENARKKLSTQEELSDQMKAKIASLEKALNDRDVAAATGVFTNLNNNAVVNKNGVVNNENKKKTNGGIDGWHGGGGAATTSEAEASENVVSGLEERMAALEAALKSTKGGPGSAQGELAAMVAMNALQEKVKALEQAWGQRNATADAATQAISKMDALAAQVQALQQLTNGEGYRSMVKDASGADLPPHVHDRVAMLEANLKAAAVDAAAVPELRKQVSELRDALDNVTNGNSSPNGLNSKSAGAANANLQAITDRVSKLEKSLSATESSPLSLDVLYAKVGAVEEGLAQTANGSAGLIQDLQAKIKELEGKNGVMGVSQGGIAGAVNDVISKAFPKPKPPAAAAPIPAPPVKPPAAPVKAPAFKTPAPPKPKTDVPPVQLPPDFTPAFVVEGGSVKKSPDLPPPAMPPAPKQEELKINLPDDDDFELEEGTLPRIATGREVMLQGFNWESHKFDWYNLVKERAGQISEAGFTQIWLPPCTDSLAPEGYLPRNLRSLETKYGGEAELRALIGELRNNNVLPVLDAVLNHRCATHQGAGGKWNRWEGTGMDWGEWAITNRNGDFAGQGGDPTGDEFWGSPNIDHRNEIVQKDICEWIKWLTHDVGFGGIRFDFSKGYGGEFTGKYVRACMPEFAVGEYWDTLDYGQGLEYNQDAHRQRTVDWIDQTGGICTAFDFTTKGILQEACGRSEFWRLVDTKGRAPGVIGLWPGRAVTFIDNHDTGSTQSHWPFPSNKVGMGYAYTLTHPGTPSVFWDHYFDWGDDLRNQIKGLMKAREDAGIHSRSKLEIVAATDQVYAALVGDRMAVKLGHDGWSPSGDGWSQAVSGDGWCVWTRGK